MNIATQRFAVLANLSDAPEVVLLHGWGRSSSIWCEWLFALRQYCHVTLVDLPGYGGSEEADLSNIDHLLDSLMAQLPSKAIYCGYSLGGMLALALAQRFPTRVSACITVASNLKFVADEQWPSAMHADTFQKFYNDVKNNSSLGLKRFASLLVRGSADERTLLKSLRTKNEDISATTLVDSLQLLASLNNSDSLSQLAMPVFSLFGDNDNLVPVEAAKALQMQGKDVIVLDQASHYFIVSHAAQCIEAIQQFLTRHHLLNHNDNEKVGGLDKRAIARSFSRAATTYDSVADLQRQVGNRLLTMLPKQDAELVMDLGCGTGFFSSYLKDSFPNSQLVGVDLAEGMVSHAASQFTQANWLCADAENLALADQSVDVIFSSLAVQWCENYQALFAEAYRVLKPGGTFAFSTLGPNTLHELRSSWEAVDQYVHVNRFVDQSVLFNAMSEAGFAVASNQQSIEYALASQAAYKVDEQNTYQWLEEDIVLEYGTLKTLTRELKLLGAHNVNDGRAAGLTGKQRMRGFVSAYEKQRNPQGLLPATYQVWYGCIHKT